MFYIWHTLLITVFIVLAYGLGYKFGKVKKVKPTLTLVDTWSDKETSHEDWLKGYHKWKKQSKFRN